MNKKNSTKQIWNECSVHMNPLHVNTPSNFTFLSEPVILEFQMGE